MTDTLRIKRRTTGLAGAPSSLANAELAYNEVDHTLYYGEGTGGAGGTATTVVPIAGQGAFLKLTGGTLTGALTINPTGMSFNGLQSTDYPLETEVFSGSGYNNTGLYIASAGGAEPSLVGFASQGTIAAPTPPLSTQSLWRMSGRAYDGSAWSGDQAAIMFKTNGVWSPSNHGTFILFMATPPNSVTRNPSMLFNGTGHLLIGTNDATRDNGTDSLQVLGSGSFSGALTVTGVTTLQSKLSFNNAIASSAQDLTHGIDLYGGTYGFCITGGTLNYNTSNGTHYFWSGGSPLLYINTGGMAVFTAITLPADPTSALQASTKQYVDNRTVPPLANIAALRANTAITAPVWVRGYRTDTDGGEGMFVYVSSDTSSADNGGTIIVDASSRRWYRERQKSDAYNVRWFGAYGDGSHDDTSAIQATLNAASNVGAAVHFPGVAAFYLVSSAISITNNHDISGDYATSTIKTSNLTADIFTVNATGVFIHGLGFGVASGTAANAYVDILGANDVRIDRCSFLYPFTGIQIGPNFGESLYITNCYFYSPVANGSGIRVGSGYALQIFDCIMIGNIAVGGTSAVLVSNCADLLLTRCEFMGCDSELVVNPGQGQAVSSLWATDTFFDTPHSYGAIINPTGNGQVVRCRFMGCWFSSAQLHHGVSVQGSSPATVQGIEFIDCHAFLNNQNGFDLSYGTDFTLVGCKAAANTQSGIAVSAGVSQFTITSCTSGPCSGLGANAYGIWMGSGLNFYVVANNRLNFNNTTNFFNGSAGAANAILAPNLQ